jgi:hypothetical protein
MIPIRPMLQGKYSCTIGHVTTTFQRGCLLISLTETIIVGLCLYSMSLPAAAEEISVLEIEQQPDQADPRAWKMATTLSRCHSADGTTTPSPVCVVTG